VKHGAVVAMLLPRSVDAYAVILGILRWERPTCRSTRIPAQRIKYILNDSGATALVTTAKLAQRHAAFHGAVVRVDADRGAIAAADSTRCGTRRSAWARAISPT